MSDVSAAACLAQAKVFGGLDDEGRERLARLATMQTLSPEEVLIEEGTPGDAFFLAIRGLFRVDVQNLDGTPRRVDTVQPGTVLGEIGVLTREPRTATITAQTDAAVLRFEMLSVLTVLKDYPDTLAELNRLGVERSEKLLEWIVG